MQSKTYLSLTFVAAYVLSGCTSMPASPKRITVETDQFNRGERVESVTSPRELLFTDKYQPTDVFVRTVSFTDGSGTGYFETKFQRLPGSNGSGDVASVVVTKAYCASAPQHKLGISLGMATPTPFCTHRTDLPVKTSARSNLQLIPGAKHKVDLGDGDRVEIRLIDAA